MKKLNDLYPGIGTSIVIKDVKNNYNEVVKDDLFVCNVERIPDFDKVERAISNGASALVTNRSVIDPKIPTITVPDPKKEYPYLCQKFYDYPDNKLKTIGVFGSEGKTTTAIILQSLLGINQTGYIGSSGKSCAAFNDNNSNVILDSSKVYNTLDEFIKFGCKYAVIEGTEKSLSTGNLQSINYDLCIFTNLVNEYLDNMSFTNYYNNMVSGIKQTKNTGYFILNSDDPSFNSIKDNCLGNVLTYGTSSSSTLQIIDYKIGNTKTIIKFKYNEEEFEVNSPLVALFNVYNLAGAMLTALALGYKIEYLVKKIDGIFIPGRMNVLNTDSTYNVIVDYAHTINNFYRVKEFVGTLDINHIYIVFSSVLDKSIEHLNNIGKVLCDFADHVIFSYDDSSNEVISNVNYIVSTVKDYSNYSFVSDRKVAIEKAIEMANDKDLVLILGKGNLVYQKLEFNDIDVAYQAMALKKIKENS